MKKIGKLAVKNAAQIEKSHMSIGFECLDRDLFKPEMCYDPAAAAGIKHARVQTGWLKCEREKGVYNFAWLDEIVDNLIRRGILPWFNVGYGNPLYMPDTPFKSAVGCVPVCYGEEVMAAWENYCTALAEHFRDRITHYEIWNESDIKAFWYPGEPNGEQLAEMVKRSGRAIRKSQPDAQIGTCTAHAEPDYITDLFSNLSAGDIDFFAFHTYDHLPERSIEIEKQMPVAREIMREHGFGHISLWMGEGGHASWHPVGHGQCKEGGGSEHRQAVWHLRRALLDLEAGLERTSLFLIADMWERPYEKATSVLAKPAAQGILNGLTYTPKKAYETMGYLCTVLSGDVKLEPPFASLYFNSDIPVKNVCFSVDGKRVFAYWLAIPVEEEDAEPRVLRPRKFTMMPTAAFRDPVMIDMFTGEVFAIEDELYAGTPIGEYPRLICERGTFEIE